MKFESSNDAAGHTRLMASRLKVFSKKYDWIKQLTKTALTGVAWRHETAADRYLVLTGGLHSQCQVDSRVTVTNRKRRNLCYRVQ